MAHPRLDTDRNSPHAGYCEPGRDVGVRWDDYLIAWSNPEGLEGEDDCIQAITDADRMLCTGKGSELALEGRRLFTA